VASERSAEDDLAVKRLSGLLGYVEQLVKLDENPAPRLSQHRLADGSQFILHQHEMAGLPGIAFDISDDDGPIWLRIERLQRTRPPEIAEECSEWIEISVDPSKLSPIREIRHVRVIGTEKDRLIETGEVRPEDCAPSLKAAQQDEPTGQYFDVMLRLEDRPAIKEAIERYCSGAWVEWAEFEKLRRRSIGVYQRLFEIGQRLLQSGGSESVELIWGIGLSRWSHAKEAIDIPMIERSVEIEIADQSDAAITIRPRSAKARVELRPFEKHAADRLIYAEDAARRCLSGIEANDSEGVSPFKTETFEPILKICGSSLDPEGRYLPDHRQLAATEPLPPAEGGSLMVTDRYVLFARRRSSNSVLHDIERLKGTLAPNEDKLPVLEGAARTLVMGPRDGLDKIRPLGDKIGTSDSVGAAWGSEPVDPEHGDLFFPKPFNDDQVQIIRRLEKSDGIVVQGPPGTGKTHTIANIISHMLATGRRVLVVSHGETALKVIRDQLPEGVRDLTISVASSERDGLKQIEKAINLMLKIVTDIAGGQQRQRKIIFDLEANIVKSRKRLAQIDEQISTIAARHFSPVPGGTETPYEVARRVNDERSWHEWFTDRPRRPFVGSGVATETVQTLAAARQRVGADLKFLNEQLPSPANLPDAQTLSEWHRDLIAARSKIEAVADSEPLLRRVVTKVGLEEAENLARVLKDHAQRILSLQQEPWVWSLIERQDVELAALERVRAMLLDFLREASELVNERGVFVARPVSLPSELPPSPHRETILDSLAEGKNPFGLLAFALKPYRQSIAQIRVAGLPPHDNGAWHHVRSYVVLHGKLTSLSVRWAALRTELFIPDHVHFSAEQPSALDAIADWLHIALVVFPSDLSQLAEYLTSALGSRDEASSILRYPAATAAFGEELASFISARRLSGVQDKIKIIADQFRASSCELAMSAIDLLNTTLGSPKTDAAQLQHIWTSLRAKLARLRELESSFHEISKSTAMLAEAGAPIWSERLLTEPATADADPVIPVEWQQAWDWAANLTYLERIGASADLSDLHRDRLAIEKQLRDDFASLVKERTFFNLAATMKGSAKGALNAFAQLIRRIGKGTGKGAALHRRDARKAMENCYDAVPCWIMSSWRVSEQLPAVIGSFDLVILDEASQSDARELPALLRGKKVLVVGDDRQVSPGAAFVSIANIQRLCANYLTDFPFHGQVEPGASLYDLARVMFPDKFVMLKEHFRCVEPIIRFSMKFYDEPLIPLRIPKAYERLDPPLVDILVEDGERRGKSKVNPPEAEIIVTEIERLVNDPDLATIGGDEHNPRSIGVISLIGAEQANFIQKRLMDRIGEVAMVRHRIMCGDSASFQGDERDIIFLSMIADRKRKQAQTATQYEQRFNVALSRARDRMILVRSVTEADLNPKDLKALVIRHFNEPMPAPLDSSAALIDLCQSDFERDLFAALIERGYRVIPQVGSEGFSIDMVVEGDGGQRLAVECDGDLYHGPERWADDMRRQRILERVGWMFWRCFGSTYTLDRDGMLNDLFETLDRMGIRPVGVISSGTRFTEHKTVRAKSDDDKVGDVDQTQGPAVDRKPSEGPESEPDSRLVVGDRIVIKYLDDPKSRQECYILIDGASDQVNGLLSLASPLAQALSDAFPGDEVNFQLADRERSLLYLSLERATKKAA
jgi:hypothetical protein